MRRAAHVVGARAHRAVARHHLLQLVAVLELEALGQQLVHQFVQEVDGIVLALLHVLAHGARVVEHDIPLATLELLQAVIAIAFVELQIREQFAVRPPTIEQLHFMAASQRFAHHVGANKSGTAENQDPECAGFARSR